MIKEWSDKKSWNSFVRRQAIDGGFLQSWEWGEFQQEKLGRKIWRLAEVDNGELQAVALVIKQPLPFGQSYLYIPRGPIFTPDVKSSEEWTDYFKQIAAPDKSTFLRMDPAWPSNENVEKVLRANGFRNVKEVQPQETLIINIDRPAEEIMAGMKQKTRYNIRLAEKKGVTTRISSEQKDVDSFWKLMAQTSTRNTFSPHPRKYYQNLIDQFGEGALEMKIFVAEYQGRVLAANIVAFFGDHAYYLHGASSNQDRQLMAPYFLHWKIIEEAKSRNLKQYDLWGITTSPDQNHPWAGITRFKRGFDQMAQATKYVGAWDYVFRPRLYRLYEFAKNFRSK